MADQSDSIDQTRAISLVQKLTEAKAAEADRVALWKDIEEQFGGRKEFVREMHRLYGKCTDGSANKVRMGSLFLEIYAKAADLTSSTPPESELTNEELAAALAEISKHGLQSAGQADSP